MKKILPIFIVLFSLLSCNNDSSSNNYYENLKKDCEKKDSKNCCLSSVKIMEENNYKLVNKKENGNTYCDEGYEKNLLRCIDSYTRCEKKN